MLSLNSSLLPFDNTSCATAAIGDLVVVSGVEESARESTYAAASSEPVTRAFNAGSLEHHVAVGISDFLHRPVQADL